MTPMENHHGLYEGFLMAKKEVTFFYLNSGSGKRSAQFFSMEIHHKVWAKMAYIHSNRANFEPNAGKSISKLTQMFNLHTKSPKIC